MNSANITTDRLILEELNESHSEAVVNLRNNEKNIIYFKNPNRITLKQHNEWYKKFYLNNDKRYDFVIKLKASGEIVGTCGISNLDINHKTAEVSYLLSANHRGRGYATEAVLSLIEFGYVNWGITNFCAVIHKDNTESICFVEKMGFTKIIEKSNFFEYMYYRNNR